MDAKVSRHPTVIGPVQLFQCLPRLVLAAMRRRQFVLPLDLQSIQADHG